MSITVISLLFFVYIFILTSPSYAALTISQTAKTQEFRNIEIPFVTTNDYTTSLSGEEIYIQNSKGEISVFYNAGGGKIQDLGVKFNPPVDIELTKILVDKKSGYMITADVNGTLKLFNNTGYLLNNINTNQYIIGIALGDIDNDTQNEVAVVTIKENEYSPTGFESYIYTYKYTSGSFFGPMATLGPYDYNFSCITVGDYDNDGKNEILLGTEDGRVIVIDDTRASFPLAYLLPGSIVTDIEIADVDNDNDNKNEVVFTTGYDDAQSSFWQGYVYVYKDSTLQWQLSDLTLISKAMTSVEIGDIDADGVQEIITVANNSDFENQIWNARICIFKFDQTTKTYIGGQTQSPIDTIISDIALGDIDGDTKPEILVYFVEPEENGENRNNDI